MTTTQYIFQIKDDIRSDNWVTQDPDGHGGFELTTLDGAVLFFEDLRRQRHTHIRVIRLDVDGTWSDVSNDIESEIERREEDAAREDREDRAHMRSEAFGWEQI